MHHEMKIFPELFKHSGKNLQRCAYKISNIEEFFLAYRLSWVLGCFWGKSRVISGEKLATQLMSGVQVAGTSHVHVTPTFPPQRNWLLTDNSSGWGEFQGRINHTLGRKLLKLLGSSNLAHCKGLKRVCEANWWLVLLFLWGLLILVQAASPLQMWSKYQCFHPPIPHLEGSR